MRIRTPHVIRSSRRDADKVPSADVQRPAVLLPQGLLDDRLHVLVLADTHEAARELSDRFDPDSREWTVTLAAPGRGTSPDIATAVDVVVLSLARCSTDVMAFGLGLRDVLDDPE